METFCIEMKNPTDEDWKALTQAMNEVQDATVRYIDNLAQELGIEHGDAAEVWYERTRSRWTQAWEDAFIARCKA